MSDITRKKHTGEAGNGGQFGSKTNSESEVQLFASTPPINDDPKPFIDQWGTYRSEDGNPAGYDFDTVFYHSPRAGFDRPRAHKANPILEDFREDWAANRAEHENSLSLCADRWLMSACEEPTARDFYTDTHIDHARRVLTRLANFEHGAQA